MLTVYEFDGNRPIEAWLDLVTTVCRDGAAHNDIKEILNLLVVISNARQLRPKEISRYRQAVGDDIWRRVTSLYTKPSDLRWKPSYIGRLVRWQDNFDQLEEVVRKATRFPGSKTLVCSIFNPLDLRRARVIPASVPCVVAIDFKIRQGKVNLSAFFRSQDVYRLFLADLHYLAKIQAYVTDHLKAANRGKATSFETGQLTFYLASAHAKRSLAKRFGGKARKGRTP